MLAGYLGHASRDIFRNIFAFTIDELQSLDSLSDKDTQGRLYGAGLGSLSLASAESEIEKMTQELFKPRGSAQRIALAHKVQVLHDPADRAPLARGVPTLEHHDDPGAVLPDPVLHLHELLLEPPELLLVELAGQLAVHAPNASHPSRRTPGPVRFRGGARPGGTPCTIW